MSLDEIIQAVESGDAGALETWLADNAQNLTLFMSQSKVEQEA